MTKCGDFGGLTTKGEPCKRAAGWGVPDTTTGRCKDHLEQEPPAPAWPVTVDAPDGYRLTVEMEGDSDRITRVVVDRAAFAPDPDLDPDPEPPDEFGKWWIYAGPDSRTAEREELVPGREYGGKLYIEYEPASENVTAVQFSIEGEPVTRERVAPYTLMGDDSGVLKPWDTTHFDNGMVEILADVEGRGEMAAILIEIANADEEEPVEPPPDPEPEPPPPDPDPEPEPPPPGPEPPPEGDKPELPRVWVNTDWIEPQGPVIRVPAGTSLQAALDAAPRPSVLELDAGATYGGNLTLPAKPGTGWVIIRSAGALPPLGTRMTPARAANLARIVTTRADQRAMTTAAGASHYRIVGVEFTAAASVTQLNAMVGLGANTSFITLDRVYIHGHAGLNLQRGLMLHAAHGAVIDSWLSECHYKGQDSQAIIAWSTPGPLKIVNNHLEGAGENVMLGGATPSGDNNPSDVEIRRNHFYKPQSWRLPDGSSLWTVKNLFEIKFGRRVLLEGNVFDGNWSDGQDGHAFNFKKDRPAEDITFRYNIVRNTRHGMKFGGNIPRWLVEHNLIIAEDRLFTILSSTDLVIRNNTAVHGHNIITSTGSNNTRFVATGNIWGSTGGYGVKGDGRAEGTSTLNAHFTGHIYQQNCHIGRKDDRYPEGNRFVGSQSEVLFDADYRLRAGSPFAGLGADIDALLAATAGVVQ